MRLILLFLWLEQTEFFKFDKIFYCDIVEDMLSRNFELIFLPKYRGGSGFFSREGWADFQTIFEKFDDLFFVDQIDFPSSPRTLKRRFFGQIFCAAGKFSARQANLVYIGAEGVFRKNLGSVGQKWIS